MVHNGMYFPSLVFACFFELSRLDSEHLNLIVQKYCREPPQLKAVCHEPDKELADQGPPAYESVDHMLGLSRESMRRMTNALQLLTTADQGSVWS